MKLHLYDLQGIVLVYFSDNSLVLCEKKKGRKYYVHGKRETAYFHV